MANIMLFFFQKSFFIPFFLKYMGSVEKKIVENNDFSSFFENLFFEVIS